MRRFCRILEESVFDVSDRDRIIGRDVLFEDPCVDVLSEHHGRVYSVIPRSGYVCLNPRADGLRSRRDLVVNPSLACIRKDKRVPGIVHTARVGFQAVCAREEYLDLEAVSYINEYAWCRDLSRVGFFRNTIPGPCELNRPPFATVK